MTDPIEIYTQEDFTVEIYLDPHPPNPRVDFSNLGRFCVTDWFNESLDPKDIMWQPEQSLKDHHGSPIPVLLPVYKYDHGGVALKTTPFSCPWDSGQIGWIYATQEDLKKCYLTQAVTPEIIETATQVLAAEVQQLSDYLNGQVFGYKIYQGNELWDSCWGFYGGPDEAKDNALAEIRHYLGNTPATRTKTIQLLGA